MRFKNVESTEFRYMQIVRLSESCKTQKAISILVGCSEGLVNSVLKRYKTSGLSGLKVKPAPKGKVPKLSKEDFEKLKLFLSEGSLKHGFETDNWSRERIAMLIKTRFSQEFHVSSISRLMQKIGFSLQKPIHRSYRQDEAAVETWKKERLPELKKNPKKKIF